MEMDCNLKKIGKFYPVLISVCLGTIAKILIWFLLSSGDLSMFSSLCSNMNFM